MTGPAFAQPPQASAIPPLLAVVAAQSAGMSGGSSMEHTSAGGGSQAQSGAQLDALLAHLQANSAGAVAAMDVQSARDARGTAGMAAGRAASSPAATARGGSRPSRTTSEPRPANSYNARHQQAEARRRSRINERLEALRQLVPHTERANTANFLEELVAYVQRMQGRVVELERQLGLPQSIQLPSRAITFNGADDAPEQTLHTTGRADRRAPASSLGLPALPLPPVQQPLLPLPVSPGAAVGADASTAAAIAAALLQQQAQQAMFHQQQQAQQAQLQQLLLHGAAAAVTGLGAPLQGGAGLQGLHLGGFKLPMPPAATQAGSAPMPGVSQPATATAGTAGQATALGSAAALGGGGGAAAAGGPAQSSGSRPGDSGGAQGSAGLQALAAADSLGALSAGCASGLRSASVHPGQAPAPVGEGARKRPEAPNASGIPTDEELASLADHLTQDTKRPRLLPNGA